MATISKVGENYQTSGLRFTPFGLELVFNAADSEFANGDEVMCGFLGHCVTSLKDKTFSTDEEKRDFIMALATSFFNLSPMVSGAPLITVTLNNNVIVIE